MADQHQVNSIIATAICDAGNDQPDHRMDPEEAKQIAKCIIEALTDAGVQIVPRQPKLLVPHAQVSDADGSCLTGRLFLRRLLGRFLCSFFGHLFSRLSWSLCSLGDLLRRFFN
jgi:hypothetical protein